MAALISVWRFQVRRTPPTEGVCNGSDSFVGANILCRSAGLFKLRRPAVEVAKSPSMQAKTSGRN